MSDDLLDHGDEGIELTVATPSVTAKTLLYLITTLVLGAIVWSYFGEADVVISCQGIVVPTSEPRRVYSPVPGELVDVYVTRGESVTEGTVLALIKAPSAIQAAMQALTAKAQYEAMKRQAKLLPKQKEMLQQQLSVLKERKQNELSSIGETQEQEKDFKDALNAKRDVIKDRLARSARAIKRAKRDMEKYKGLLDAGAVSKNEYEEKELAYKMAEDQSKSASLQARSELSRALDENRARKLALKQKQSAIVGLELQITKLEDQISNMSEELGRQLEMARVQMEAAQKVTFKDLDNQNFLQIRAPIDGIITEVAYTQAGDKVQATSPFFTINPPDDDMAIQIRISDKDRAFLTPGPDQRVKIKVRAFPYMKYGMKNGYLERISPSPKFRQDGITYDGRVLLSTAEDSYFMIKTSTRGDVRKDLRHGMSVRAEIVVEQKRLIEFALDSFRKKSP